VITLLTNEPQSVFVVYPNPALNTVNVKANQKIIVAELINETGLIIPLILTNTKEFLYQFDVQKVPAGLYFLRIETTDNSFINKLIINH
jgi:Secretion system C-terminal sorting domain